MLANFKKSVTITGQSVIETVKDGITNRIEVESYSATINSDNPEDISIYPTRLNHAMYKANRTQCREDTAGFEEAVYVIQDQMIAEKAASETK